METPRVYYNTITIDDDGLGFIVGLIREVYSPSLANVGRTRQLLAYQPQLGAQTPALPVYHETLNVLTRADWAQTNSGERITSVSTFFNTYRNLDRLTCFQTFTPPQPIARLWHILPNDYWPNLIANARLQLEHDLDAFINHRPATLPKIAPPLQELGYFTD